MGKEGTPYSDPHAASVSFVTLDVLGQVVQRVCATMLLPLKANPTDLGEELAWLQPDSVVSHVQTEADWKVQKWMRPKDAQQQRQARKRGSNSWGSQFHRSPPDLHSYCAVMGSGDEVSFCTQSSSKVRMHKQLQATTLLQHQELT